MVPRESRIARSERGQATILLLGVVAALLLGLAIAGAFGQALGAKGRHQRAADLAAMSAARTMSRAYPRLFEAAYLENGAPNPSHISNAAYVVPGLPGVATISEGSPALPRITFS